MTAYLYGHSSGEFPDAQFQGCSEASEAVLTNHQSCQSFATQKASFAVLVQLRKDHQMSPQRQCDLMWEALHESRLHDKAGETGIQIGDGSRVSGSPGMH